jgi:hypothetical protein
LNGQWVKQQLVKRFYFFIKPPGQPVFCDLKFKAVLRFNQNCGDISKNRPERKAVSAVTERLPCETKTGR